jgi:hypothetical protein
VIVSWSVCQKNAGQNYLQPPRTTEIILVPLFALLEASIEDQVRLALNSPGSNLKYFMIPRYVRGISARVDRTLLGGRLPNLVDGIVQDART